MKTIILTIPAGLLERIQIYGMQNGRIPVSAIIRKAAIEGTRDEYAYPVYGSARNETKKIAIRLTDTEINAIDSAASTAGNNRTAWIIAQLERVFG